MESIDQGVTFMFANRGGPPGRHWIIKALDAALTAHLRPKENARQMFYALVNPRSSNYRRVSSLLNLIDRMKPGTAKKTAHNLLNCTQLPFYGCQIGFLAFGSGTTVFLLEVGQEKRVLKVFRRSLGQPIDKVWATASLFQEKHRRLVSWFNQPDEIVIPSQCIVLHGPLLGIASAAIIQPFVGGKIFDLFLDFNVEQILQLGKTDLQFGSQLLEFSRRVFRSISETGQCFDLVGRENLMLVEANGKMKLAIADNGIFDLLYLRRNRPALYNQLQAHLQHLKLIQEGLERG